MRERVGLLPPPHTQKTRASIKVCVWLRTSARLIFGTVLIVSSPSAKRREPFQKALLHKKQTVFCFGANCHRHRRVPTIKCWVACVRDAFRERARAQTLEHARDQFIGVRKTVSQRINYAAMRFSPGDAATRAQQTMPTRTLVFVNLCATMISQEGPASFWRQNPWYWLFGLAHGEKSAEKQTPPTRASLCKHARCRSVPRDVCVCVLCSSSAIICIFICATVSRDRLANGWQTHANVNMRNVCVQINCIII